METLIRDIRYAARLLRCSPLFTFTAALSIAAGVGVDTTVGHLCRSRRGASTGTLNPDSRSVFFR
jgi:hypothetical protein